MSILNLCDQFEPHPYRRLCRVLSWFRKSKHYQGPIPLKRLDVRGMILRYFAHNPRKSALEGELVIEIKWPSGLRRADQIALEDGDVARFGFGLEGLGSSYVGHS